MEETTCQKGRSLLKAVLLPLALGAVGFSVYLGLLHFRREGQPRTLAVRGLVEERVKADFVLWRIPFASNGPDLSLCQKKMDEDGDKIKTFLKKQGFEETDFYFDPVRVVDNTFEKRDAAKEALESNKFSTLSAVVVRTKKVDLVGKALNGMGELVNQGVMLWSGNAYTESAPAFEIQDFSSLRPALFAKAIVAAKMMADKFSKETGIPVKGILSANQGSFEIFGDTNNAYEHQKSPHKMIRLVSSFMFELGK